MLLEYEPVGINRQVEEVKELLEMEGSIPSIAVILYGFGGVGKSTLAKSVIDKLILTNYKFCRVIVDAENPAKNLHIAKLQKNILSALGEGKLDFDHPEEGRQKLRKALENKSVFIFIDNIVEEKYVEELLPKNLSGPEKQKMRLLITSRTNAVRQELSFIDSHCIKDYSVERLSDETAIELLRFKVRGDCNRTSSADFDEDVEINAVAKACFGVPLLLDTYGGFLKEDRSKNAYKYALRSLQEGNFRGCTDIDLSSQVLYVYDKMDEEAKEAFLDICVFFYGWEWDLVASIVDEMILKKLMNRALVKKNKSHKDEVSVHDVLRLMGRKKAGDTRLQSIEELSKVLAKGREAITKVRGIWLLDNKSPFNFKCKDLEEMHESLRVLALGDLTTLDGGCWKPFRNLRFLQMGSIDIFPFESISDFGKLAVIHNESIGGMQLSELPPALKQIKLTLLTGHDYAFTTLPIIWKNIRFLTNLQKFELQNKSDKQVAFPGEFVLPECVVEVDLCGCKDLPKDFGRLTSLTKLKLNDCGELITLPQVCELRSLKCLDFNECEKLTELLENFGQLSSLQSLGMWFCKNLSALAENFGKLSSLQSLNMWCCENFSALPESFGQLSSLQSLGMGSCENLSALPESFGQLSSLQSLGMRYCGNLSALPESFGQLSSLQSLGMRYCGNLSALPESFGQLSSLQSSDMGYCGNLSALPESFGQLSSLQSSDMGSCGNLSALLESFGQLSSLQSFDMQFCENLIALPENFGQLSSLQSLHMRFCENLSALPENFGQLSSLQSLDMGSCWNLSALPENFGQLSSLQSLGMGSCENLSALPESFGQLSSLQSLDMGSYGNLSALPESFGQLSSLQSFDM